MVMIMMMFVYSGDHGDDHSDGDDDDGDRGWILRLSYGTDE